MKKKWIWHTEPFPCLTKTWRIMRLSLFFLSLMVAQSWAIDSYSQATRISLNLKDTRVIDVLGEIEEKTEFFFLFNQKLVDVERKVDIEVRQRKIDEILTELFAGTNVSYMVMDRQIVLTTAVPGSDGNSQKAEVQQQNQVTGQVTDRTGAPLPGVTVVIKGTATGTITDVNGNYILRDVSPNSTLVFSFVGMHKQEVVVGNKTKIDIRMEEETIGLEEVVAIGYGTMKKADLTGAVSSVRSKDLPPAANTSISQMLAGRATGLTSMQVSAQPGGSVSMQIRGEASGRSPLIVIDGIAQTGFSQVGSAYIGSIGNIETSLNAINPNDIESVEVLKDASATAIYGARAAGGVIMITTKRGKEGKAIVSYKGSISTQNYYGLPKMMNITEFMTEANEALKETWMRANLVSPYGAKTLDQAIADSQAAGKALWVPQYTDSDIANPGTGTDWYDIITRNGLINEQNISVAGGTDKTRYMSSIGYYNQKGIIENSDMNRFTLRFNLDQKFSKYVSGGLSANVSQINTGNVPLGTGANENSGIIRAALEFNPTVKVKDENGNYCTDPLRSTSVNPASMLEITDKSRTERLLMSSYIQIDPFKGFNVRVLLGVDRNQGKRNYYLPTSVIFGQREGGYASIANNEKTDYTFNTIANWMKKWNDHSLTVMGGFEYQKFTWNSMNAYNSEFPYDGILWYNLNAGKRVKPGVGSSGGSSEMASYITRINYTFKNKYLLTLNGRVDGSSNFAENNQWGLFSGIAVAWKIHEENFMVNTRDWLSELKLRAGYGRTGNDNMTGINTYYSSGWNYILGNKYQTGIGLASIGNPDLTWEKQTDINVGLDFGFLQQQITGSIEYFDRTVYDILGTKRLMSYQEVNTIAANLDAEKQSKGIEFSLHSNSLNHRDLTWTTDLNVTYYRDRWKKRDKSWIPDIYDSYNAQFRELWYYKSDGLVSVDDTEYIKQFGAIPGTVKILDVNGYKVGSDGKRELDENGKPQYSGSPDGKIDNADLVKVGVNTPVNVGLNNSLTYKGFDLNIYIYGMFNRWKINDTRAYFLSESFRVREGKKMYVEVIDRWSYKNMNSNVPSIFQANSKYGTGDFFLEKAWFIRCRMTLGYSLPQDVIRKIASSARFFVDAQNPFIITPYSGTDPETDSMAAYPNQRTFTLGVDIKF